VVRTSSTRTMPRPLRFADGFTKTILRRR
jgi:hypothetical protein